MCGGPSRRERVSGLESALARLMWIGSNWLYSAFGAIYGCTDG